MLMSSNFLCFLRGKCCLLFLYLCSFICLAFVFGASAVGLLVSALAFFVLIEDTTCSVFGHWRMEGGGDGKVGF